MGSKNIKNEIHSKSNEPIAIIGMSCRFPGMDQDVEDVGLFYEMLMKGQSPIKDVPKNRWDIEQYYDPDRSHPDKMVTRKGGFLNHPDRFDADFFKISPIEAKQMDPQHRLFLEVSIRALNDANITFNALRGTNTGVFCGVSTDDYGQLNCKDNIRFNEYTQIGAANSGSIGRLCLFLDLKGPSMVVDTACSSSLSALYLAALALRAKQCSLAIVGGVHLNLCPENFIGLSKANMLSAVGECRSFDRDADGFVRSDGCGVLVVKRLSDALEDGNRIHAVLRSVVMNQNGNGSSVVAPNLKAQIALHEAALSEAQLGAQDIQYIETHGTGTQSGDSVEFNAIKSVHQGYHTSENPLVLGALKSSLGHTISSSGIASLIKVICAMKEESIPPNLHYNAPNKLIDLESIPVLLPLAPLSFHQQKNQKRYAQVLNFGFSGVNVSAIVEEPPLQERVESEETCDEKKCFVASADSLYSLKELMVRYKSFLQDTPASLGDICTALINARDHYKFRCAIIAADKTSLIRAIDSEAYDVKKVVLNKTVKVITDDPDEIYSHYLSGDNIRLAVKGSAYFNIDLPHYVFDRKSYWHEPRNKPISHDVFEPIAIIGMSCRFPKAADVDAFLSLLVEGENGIADIPLDRWDNKKYYSADPDAPGKLYIKQLGLLDNVKHFDAEFFNISPREAKLMSPQLRIMLETSYHAIEDANLTVHSLKQSKTGVFIGCERNDYPAVLFNQGMRTDELDIYFATGNALSALPGKIAYNFDFNGPIQLIDTACSSSITAIHNACVSLHLGDCDLALAGGVNLLLNPVGNITLSKAKMLSPDSRCKTFSEDANGYARSEGCGVLVLKRLSDALEQNDTILAVIKGTAINSDGKSEGFTVPNSAAQEAVIRSALDRSKLSPGDIDYIEAHGTGTPVADPVEVGTLTKIFSDHHTRERPLYISSVKTNIGHCESASGVASIIKAVLSLQTHTIFKHLNFKKLNPAITLKNMLIPLETAQWETDHPLRYAGVNSFGFSGANAHVVLQEALPIKKVARSYPEESLLVISAKKKETLVLLLERYVAYLSKTNEAFLDICYTAATCRSHYPFRVAILAKTARQAAEMIQKNEYTIHQVKKEEGTGSNLCKLDDLKVAYQEGQRIDWRYFYGSLSLPLYKVKLPLYAFYPKSHWYVSKHGFINLSPDEIYLKLDQAKDTPQDVYALPNEIAPVEASLRAHSSPWLNEYRGLSDDKKWKACKELLFKIGNTIQERPETDRLDEDEGFFDIGFDSLMLTEMAFMLQDHLQPTLKISVHIAFDYPSINKLASYIKNELDLTLPPGGEAVAIPEVMDDAIAIIGMSCTFPGAPDVAAFERMLEEGLSGIRDIPIERWDNSKYYHADRNAPGKSYVNRLGLIDNVRSFDANFFGISPREAILMEPQQRLFLESCYFTLENANYSAEALRGSLTGVFAGVSTNEYYAQLEKSGFSNEELSMYSITGNMLNLIPGRVSYTFDFKGPSISVDTACSSSLVAVHYACQSLKNHEIDYAFTGGVNLLLMPESNITLSKAQALSPDGLCKTFDQGADGFVRSEGCGVLLLKRLSDALRDKDLILAVIKGSAVNNDGKSAGLTVPNGQSQEEVMKKALSQSALSSEDITYIEAHGTGTPIGDPIEVQAINRVYGQHRNPSRPLYMASVKTNIGHLESASGIAGMIKTILSLQKNKMYKHLNFNQLNPNIVLTDIKIPLQTIEWNGEGKPKSAGVSAFGFSGTNAHVILQDYPSARPHSSHESAQWWVLMLSAKSKVSLEHLAERYQSYLATTADSFGDICFTAATCREHYTYRLVVVADSAASASQRLRLGQYALSHGEQALQEAPDGEWKALIDDYLQGGSIDWSTHFNPKGNRFVTLPNYTFERRVFWPEKKNDLNVTTSIMHPLLGQMLSLPDGELLFSHCLERDHLAYINQYHVLGKVIFPAAATFEMGLSAAKAVFKGRPFSLVNGHVDCLLFLSDRQELQVHAKPIGEDQYTIRFFAKQEKAWQAFAEMDLQAISDKALLSMDMTALKSSYGPCLEPSQLMAFLKKSAILSGKESLVIEEGYVNENSSLTCLALSQPSHGLAYYYHPLLLEGVLQSITLLNGDNALPSRYLPEGFKRIVMFQEAPRRLWVHVMKRDEWTLQEPNVDIKCYDSTGLCIAEIECLKLRQVVRRDLIAKDPVLNHLYHTQWQAVEDKLTHVLELPFFHVISNDPDKAKRLLKSIKYELISDFNALDSVENKNILFLYQQDLFHLLFNTCQALFKKSPKRFILVTENAYRIHSSDKVDPYHTMATSFWRSFRNELELDDNHAIDLGSGGTLLDSIRRLVDPKNNEHQLAARDGLYVPRLKHLTLTTDSSKEETLFDSKANYLIVGGSGGLSKPLIDYLIQRNAKHIALLSRSECSKALKDFIDSSSHQGVSIQHFAVDASDYQLMKSMMERLNTESCPLKGVFHLAGVAKNGIIPNLTNERVDAVLKAKMESAFILHQLTQAINLDFLVLFSSSASLLGGRGQSNYAAANGFLDGLAHLREQEGRRTLAINWGPFHTVGMAATLAPLLEEQGYITIDQSSLGTLDLFFESGLSQIAVLPVHWDVYFKYQPKQEWLAHQTKLLSSPAEQIFLNTLRHHTKEECVGILSQVLCDITANVLALNDSESISARAPLFSMGLDSLMSLEIRHRIHDKLQCEALSLPIEYFLNDPSIEKIAQRVTEKLFAFFDEAPILANTEAPIGEEFPLCDFQYQFWMLNRMGGCHNIGCQVRLQGNLSIEDLSLAFDLVVQHNDAFWIYFNEELPLQRLNKRGTFKLIVEEAGGSKNTEWLNEKYKANLNTPIPLTEQPLIRIYLYQLNHDQYELQMVFPHIIMDLDSIEIVFRSFKSNYEALLQGEKSLKAFSQRSYLDYVRTNYLRYEENLQQKIAFWQEYNQGVQGIFLGPKYQFSEALPEGSKHLFHYPLDPTSVAHFVNWHKKKNLNLSYGLIAACQIVLFEMFQKKVFPVVTIYSGREGSAYQSTVGLFIEYKRINVPLSYENTFEDCVYAIEEAFLKTAPYQNCPYLFKVTGRGARRLMPWEYIIHKGYYFLLKKRAQAKGLYSKALAPYLTYLSETQAKKITISIKCYLNHFLNWNIPVLKPARLVAFINITPSFLSNESHEQHFANIDYSYPNHYGSEDRSIGNRAISFLFTKSPSGEPLLSINGPLAPECKDKMAERFKAIISTLDGLEVLKIKELFEPKPGS